MKYTAKVCKDCKGVGFLYSNNEKLENETQRCDSCKFYKSDIEAQKASEVTA